jgi:hypothetical protein
MGVAGMGIAAAGALAAATAKIAEPAKANRIFFIVIFRRLNLTPRSVSFYDELRLNAS